jgi:small GTP-binding protein
MDATPIVVTLIGKVNAGKSSLCNRLLKKKLADVSPVAGWTKEVKKYPLGNDVFIADTPGLEDVEAAVAAKTFDFLGESDVFVHIVNANEGLTKSVAGCHEQLAATTRPVILVCNKVDADRESARQVFGQLRGSLKSAHSIETSTRTGEGLDLLSNLLVNLTVRNGDDLRLARFLAERTPEITARMDTEANSIVRWATGRAAAIAVVPVPLADIYPLIANEIYMVKQLGSNYGLELTDSMVRGFIASIGASFAGLVLASFIPGAKIAIASSITFAVGKAAKAWCRSDMKMNVDELKKEYTQARNEQPLKSTN